jgi:hypothetical protein
MGDEPTWSAARQRLNEARTAEAVALFQANQSGRNAIERVVGLFLSVGAIAGTTAAATHSADAVLPLPAFFLLLLSYMFQQYAEITVLGRARLLLEDLVNDDLTERALIYETAVAKIRQRRPLVWSVRLLQAMLAVLTLSAVGAGLVIAIRSHSVWIERGYIVATGLAAASFAFSFFHMHRAERVTEKKLKEEGFTDDRPLWVSGPLHKEVLDRRRPSEVPRQTTERLLRKALAAGD